MAVTLTKDVENNIKLLSPPPAKLAPYSVPIPGSEKEGRSAVYRNWRFANSQLLTTLDPAVRTGHDVFESSARKYPKNRCLGERSYDGVSKTWGPYSWQTYAEVAERRKNFGAGIRDLHEKAGVTGANYGVGLWCQNRPEWQITDLGCMSQSLYTVSIYDTLGPETTEYIINHSSLACVVTSLPHIPTLLKLAPRCPGLKMIICLDPLDNNDKPGNSKGAILNTIAAPLGISIHCMRDVEALGAKLQTPMRLPGPEDTITINYTSGTTGNPKGVVLTHANAVAASSVGRLVSGGGPTDVVISYLPLAHIYERVTEGGAFFCGSAIGYFHGDILGLVDDMKVLKPTGFISVPRLYNRFGAEIRSQALEAPGLKGKIANRAINTKLEYLARPEGERSNTHFLYDRIFTPKLRAGFGLERARSMVSGSAPLDPTLHNFLRAAFGNEIRQGYGLTETYAMGLVQAQDDFTTGNCGGVSPATEICLMSVPDMEYLVTDKPNPRGELLMRSTTQFKGYYKNDEETAKAITEDGWFRTGDIAEVDSRGRFKIIDRVKNVLKLAQGEYVSPERLENVYLANTGLLSQGFVHGDSHQAFLVSVWGVDPVKFAPFASKVLGKTIDPTDLEAVKEATLDERVKKAVLDELDRIGKMSKFNSYEKVRKVHLEVEPFTIENELLTPTLKLKRPQTAKKFRQHLDRMYEEALAEEQAKPPMAKL